MTTQDKEEKVKLLDSVLSKLAEHFDAVEIAAACLQPDGDTQAFFRGSGLWHARIGLCQEFVDMDRQKDQAIEIARELKDD
jgi:hypothetical protein